MIWPFLALLRQGDSNEITVDIDGVQRSAIVEAPTTPGPHPVVFGFHGHGGNSTFAARRFDLQRYWPDAIVIYPLGIPRKTPIDPAGQRNGWDVDAADSNPDIKLTDKLLKLAITKYGGDAKRVFAMGHSNGAGFMYVLWCMRPAQFAGFGVYEGYGGDRFQLTPKPLFVTIGQEDRIVRPAIQERALAAAKKADQSGEGQPSSGSNIQRFPGIEPIVLWSYAGGHVFQTDAVAPMIDFFKEIAAKKK